jgi:hypothetical protein
MLFCSYSVRYKTTKEIVMRKPRRARHCVRGLTPIQETFLKAALRRSACSEPWVDDQIVTRLAPATGGMPGGLHVPIRLHDATVFPPGGRKKTAMRWCRCCGRYTPAPAIQLIERRRRHGGPVLSATLECDDCRISADFEQYRELYEAGLHLRPASSQSFITTAGLRQRLRDKTE